MNNQKTITVDIGADGSVAIEAHNFKGVGCAKATAFLEAALGKVASTKKKPEYSQVAAQGAAQSARQ